MKIILNFIIFFLLWFSNAQITPMLDHTWTIEKIVTDDGETIMADLNPFGEFDAFTLIFASTTDNIDFYVIEEVFFGHCEMRFSFIDSNSELLYHPEGCFLSNDDSSDIALYFHDIFIEQNTNFITIDNDFFPFAFGPLDYSFRTEGDIIYLDITNTIGEVATFYANNLSQDEFLKDAISIYPNPVKDILHIDNAGIAIETMKIYDLSGRLVEAYSFNNHNQIDVSRLQRGVYILNIETSVGILKEKLIKY